MRSELGESPFEKKIHEYESNIFRDIVICHSQITVVTRPADLFLARSERVVQLAIRHGSFDGKKHEERAGFQV
jgi:hypothetical protein